MSASYQVKITDYTEEDENNKGRFEAKKVRVCRNCVKKMGYKVKKGVKHDRPRVIEPTE
jgi:hypothetical protein